MATKYMHTIDGRPAMFDQNQIVFPAYYGAVVLESSLRSIRKQQLKTEEFRLRNKFDYDPDQYGYVRVKV